MTAKKPKEERIDSILQAAVEEFVEKGYEGASVDAIAKRAGVSKGGFYHHFPNKEVLLMEANKKLSEPFYEMAQRAYTSNSVIEGLRQYMRDYIEYWVNRPRELSFLFLSLAKALEAPVLMEYYKEYIIESTAFFTGMFAKAVESGDMKIEDPEAYGISLMGALDGVLSYAIINPQLKAEDLAKRLERVLFGEGIYKGLSGK